VSKKTARMSRACGTSLEPLRSQRKEQSFSFAVEKTAKENLSTLVNIKTIYEGIIKPSLLGLMLNSVNPAI